MSLLNKVLRDLDARHASDLERQRVPAYVKPLPPEAPGSISMPKVLLAATVVLLLIALVGWSLFGNSSGQLVQLPSSTPAVAVTSAPPPQPEPPAASSQHELKLDMSEAFVKNPVSAPRAVKERPPVIAEPKAAASETAAMAVAETKPSGSIKGLPLKDFSPPADDKTGKVIVSPQLGVHNDADYRRAVSLIERGMKTEAEAQLRDILSTDPSYHAARQSLFNLLAANGREDDAATLLVEGLRLNPTNTQWAMNLARLQVERNDNAAAWETLQRSLPYANSQGNYRAFCGTVLQRLNRYGEAEEHYRAALRINPTEGRWWVGFALTLEADNKSTESREAFSRAQATGTLPPDLVAFVEGKLKK
jgi:MSHA biogenesis protein MshN